MARNFFDSEKFWALLFLFMVVSIGVSMASGEWMWFARSGSVLVLGGLILSGRAILRNGVWDDILAELTAGGHEQLEQREKRERTSDLHNAKLGMYFAGLGTVIWGYGDLVAVLVRLVNRMDGH